MNNSSKSGFDPTRLVDLTEAEDIKKWQEYTEELHKKSSLKKEFIGPGLHLRPVYADHAQPPLQGLWTLCLESLETTTEG